jgi:LuxR family transcriptional regulator, quorum-sensing system regulator BjaR1
MDTTVKALALVSQLSAAPSVTRAMDVFEEGIGLFGFRLYRTGAMVNPKRAPENYGFTSNWSKEWAEHYEGIEAARFDPILREACTGKSFFWRDVSLKDEAAQTLMRDAAEIGMRDGYTFIRGGGDTAPCMVFLAGDDLQLSAIDQGVVKLLADTFMGRVLYLRDMSSQHSLDALTERERHFVEFAAIGMTDKQIARQTDLAPETVRTYWKRIRRKLKATDRAHAVAAAIWSGQIYP